MYSLYKRILKLGLTLFICIFASNPIFGQDSREATQTVELQVAGSALLAVFGPPVKLILAGAVEAGEAAQAAVENDATRLRITSLVTDGETRTITAKISEPLVGTVLKVELKEPNNHFVFSFNQGTLSGQKTLSSESEVKLVEGIRTCWSGRQDDDGYVIKYTYKAIPNSPILKSTTITVTYTISTVPSDSNV